MACGTPVLTSTVSSLPEVAGDAAIMVQPTELDAIIEGLETLIMDESLRAALTEQGLERAKQFTWERTAKQLHEIYVQMVG
jgi:glycosyltransferase involved in cell wall biosynthesis